MKPGGMVQKKERLFLRGAFFLPEHPVKNEKPFI